MCEAFLGLKKKGKVKCERVFVFLAIYLFFSALCHDHNVLRLAVLQFNS